MLRRLVLPSPIIILRGSRSYVKGLLKELLHALVVLIARCLQRLLHQSFVRHSRVFRTFHRLLLRHLFFLRRLGISLLLGRQHLGMRLVHVVLDVLA